jgi:Dihydrodipicolinate synthetase family
MTTAIRSNQTVPDQKAARNLPHGIVASSVTPFGADGKVALDRVRLHIDWLIEQGVDGISPLGSSGEFAALELADRKRVLENLLIGSGVGDPVPPLTPVSPEHLQELTNVLRPLESLELHAA